MARRSIRAAVGVLLLVAMLLCTTTPISGQTAAGMAGAGEWRYYGLELIDRDPRMTSSVFRLDRRGEWACRRPVRGMFAWMAAPLLAGLAVGIVSTISHAAGQEPSRSLQDGVYTEDQAKRGETVYQQECATCHAVTLTGGESGPPLVGSDFISGWEGMTGADLFERTRIGMPKDSPGRLGRQQYADVIAYILKSNGYPSRDTELATDLAALKQIRIVKPND
jgi:mono/diheme cytochrome c family protein